MESLVVIERSTPDVEVRHRGPRVPLVVLLFQVRDMRAHDIDMLTIGQYLAPSNSHLPVRRYVHPDTFKAFEEEAKRLGFTSPATGQYVEYESPYPTDLAYAVETLRDGGPQL